MQSEEAENIGYVIPPPVIHHFITDFERNGRYTAFPSLGIEWQKMESPFLRKALGMSVRLHPGTLRLHCVSHLLAWAHLNCTKRHITRHCDHQDRAPSRASTFILMCGFSRPRRCITSQRRYSHLTSYTCQ